LDSLQEQLVTCRRELDQSLSQSVEPNYTNGCTGQGSSSNQSGTINIRRESERGMNECGIRLSSVADHVNAPFVSVAISDNGTGMGRKNELVGSTQTQCTSNILNNIVLPKFLDSN
jgi:hypothetical protein